MGEMTEQVEALIASYVKNPKQPHYQAGQQGDADYWLTAKEAVEQVAGQIAENQNALTALRQQVAVAARAGAVREVSRLQSEITAREICAAGLLETEDALQSRFEEAEAFVRKLKEELYFSVSNYDRLVREFGDHSIEHNRAWQRLKHYKATGNVSDAEWQERRHAAEFSLYQRGIEPPRVDDYTPEFRRDLYRSWQRATRAAEVLKAGEDAVFACLERFTHAGTSPKGAARAGGGFHPWEWQPKRGTYSTVNLKTGASYAYTVGVVEVDDDEAAELEDIQAESQTASYQGAA